MFNKSIYIKRRQVLKSKFNNGILIFMGNNESPMNYRDNTYHFRQDSTFLYYFGINAPALSAIIDIDEDREIIFGAEMTLDELVWMGREESLKSKRENCGINEVQIPAALKNYVDQAKHDGRNIHFLPPYRADNEIKLAALLKINIEGLN